MNYLFLIIVIGFILFFYLFKQSIQAKIPESGLNIAIITVANSWRIEPALLKAIIKKESDFNPNAKNPSDPSYGLCGITPELAKDFGLIKNSKNPSSSEITCLYDVMNNLNICAWNLNRHLSHYSIDAAIQMHNVGEAGYNAGKRNADYLKKVKSFYEQYKKEG